jgi:hypothetical protein
MWRSTRSSACTAAKRFRDPPIRKQPTGQKAATIDRIRVGQLLHLLARFAIELCGPTTTKPVRKRRAGWSTK